MIYVDDFGYRKRKNGKRWYHLMSDTTDNEIHEFASKIGLDRNWFQGDHKIRCYLYHGNKIGGDKKRKTQERTVK